MNGKHMCDEARKRMGAVRQEGWGRCARARNSTCHAAGNLTSTKSKWQACGRQRSLFISISLENTHVFVVNTAHLPGGDLGKARTTSKTVKSNAAKKKQPTSANLFHKHFKNIVQILVFSWPRSTEALTASI